MEGIPKLHRLSCTQNSLLTGKCPFRTHSNPHKHFGHAVTGIKIVIYNQSLKTFQLYDLLYTLVLRLSPEWQSDDKFGTFPLLCPDLNGAAHHIHNILGDGHTKSCTLSPAYSGSPLPLKRRKDLLYKFLTHTDSVILHPDLVQFTASLETRILFQPDRNGSASRSKLDRIGQKIQQHLIQSCLITIDILICHIHGIHIKLQLFRMDLPADDRLQIMKHIRQTDLRFFQMDLSALNPAHIQDIIDQGKQMVTGGKDLSQIIPNLVFIINIAYSQCGKADDRIHWCPDIVRHVGKEGTLGPVCCLRRTDCLRKCLVHFPVRGTVRQNQDVFLFSIYLTTHCNIMEPAFFPCFLMNIFKIPFSLFMNLDFFQIIFLRIFMFRRMQFSQNTNISTNLFYRNTQQIFRIWADVICLICFCIQHQKDIIHVH